MAAAMNSPYAILVLHGAQMRRFALPHKRLRELLLTGVLLLLLIGLVASEYFVAQRQKLDEVIASGQWQKEKLTGLSERAKQIQMTLTRWRALRGKLHAALPARRSAASESIKEGEELQRLLTAIHSELQQMIASLPAEWPVAQGAVTSGVGMRTSPITGAPEYHAGLDIPKPLGTAVHAPGDAVVDSIDHSLGTLVLNHGQEIKTQYSHLSKILVGAHAHVSKGQLIAEVGNTGRSTGPHLHYEVRVAGVAVDPRQILVGAR